MTKVPDCGLILGLVLMIRFSPETEMSLAIKLPVTGVLRTVRFSSSLAIGGIIDRSSETILMVTFTVSQSAGSTVVQTV